MSAAAEPATKSPILGPPATTTVKTPCSRPRRLSGAATCRIVERYADRGPVAWTRARLDRSGLLAVTSLRLIPAIPFSVLNYAAGLSGVRFAPYLLGSVLGTAPGTIALVVLGDAVTGDVPPALLAVSVTGGLLGTVGALVAARRPAEDRAVTPRP